MKKYSLEALFLGFVVAVGGLLSIYMKSIGKIEGNPTTYVFAGVAIALLIGGVFITKPADYGWRVPGSASVGYLAGIIVGLIYQIAHHTYP